MLTRACLSSSCLAVFEWQILKPGIDFLLVRRPGVVCVHNIAVLSVHTSAAPSLFVWSWIISKSCRLCRYVTAPPWLMFKNELWRMLSETFTDSERGRSAYIIVCVNFQVIQTPSPPKITHLKIYLNFTVIKNYLHGLDWDLNVIQRASCWLLFSGVAMSVNASLWSVSAGARTQRRQELPLVSLLFGSLEWRSLLCSAVSQENRAARLHPNTPTCSLLVRTLSVPCCDSLWGKS